jgi:hypothetical protein
MPKGERERVYVLFWCFAISCRLLEVHCSLISFRESFPLYFCQSKRKGITSNEHWKKKSEETEWAERCPKSIWMFSSKTHVPSNRLRKILPTIRWEWNGDAENIRHSRNEARYRGSLFPSNGSTGREVWQGVNRWSSDSVEGKLEEAAYVRSRKEWTL